MSFATSKRARDARACDPAREHPASFTNLRGLMYNCSAPLTQQDVEGEGGVFWYAGLSGFAA